jgi:peroxiredoxin
LVTDFLNSLNGPAHGGINKSLNKTKRTSGNCAIFLEGQAQTKARLTGETTIRISMNNEPAIPQPHSGSHKSTPLPPGTLAPDFALKSTPDQIVNLSDFRGQPVILAFYPADWSPVCGDQMALYNEILSDFRELGAELMGISVDGSWCHGAFSQARKLHFPLLSDFEPKGAVACKYGVYREADGTTERALFVINEEGVIHWSYVSPVGVNPGADGILSALEELRGKKEAK